MLLSQIRPRITTKFRRHSFSSHKHLYDIDTAIIPEAINNNISLYDIDTAIIPDAINNNISIFRTADVVSDRWSINGNVNGGFTMSMMISAARNITSFRDTLTCTGHYLSPLIEGEPAYFHTTLLKQGKQTSTIRVDAVQNNVPKVSFTGTFGDLSKLTGVTRNDKTTNDGPRPIDNMPKFEDCTEDLWNGLNKMNIGTLYSKALKVSVPKDSPFITTLMSGKNQGEPRIDAYVEFLDGRNPCLRSLALFNDCLPPAVLNFAGMASWVPTIEYTVHTFKRPKPGPMRLSFRADMIQQGVATVNGEVQDIQGHICSVSRQLCMIRV